MSRVNVTVRVYFRTRPPDAVTPDWLIQNVLPAETRPEEIDILDASKLPKELTFRVTAVSKTLDPAALEDAFLEDLQDVALEEAKDNDILRKYVIQDVVSESSLQARAPALMRRRGRGRVTRKKKVLRKKTRTHRVRV